MAAPVGKGSDLRDRLTFPSFYDCPHEHDLDNRYLASLEGASIAYPKRHWCFFGEIVDFMPYGRVVIDVKDQTGRDARVACYDDNMGQQFVPFCKKGHTVAILYANQHRFLDGSFGFRVEDSEHMKVRMRYLCGHI